MTPKRDLRSLCALALARVATAAKLAIAYNRGVLSPIRSVPVQIYEAACRKCLGQ
jgi:hypothetical protein